MGAITVHDEKSGIAQRASVARPLGSSQSSCQPSPRGGDLPSHRFDLGKRTAGEKDLHPLAGEGTGDGAANRYSHPVDHGVLALEQHFLLLCPSDVDSLFGAYGG